jgi:hypothetical protein
MAMHIINNISSGLGAVPIATESSNLQEFEKGRIHDIDGIFSRLKLVHLTKNFFATTFSKNNQKPLSTKSNLAVICTPLILASLKSSYASHYISTKMVNTAIRIEKYMGSLCYMASIVNAAALVSLGHLITGYTALTVFGLDILTSSISIQKCIPQVNKIRMVFIKYISPFAGLMAGIATRSYLSTGCALFGLYCLLSAEYYKTSIEIKKSLPSITSLDQFKTLWTSLHDEKSEPHFEMNTKRVPLIQIPTLDPSEYPEDKILEIFDAIDLNRKDLQKCLWDRVSGIVEKDPEKAFKYPEVVTSEKDREVYRKEQLPRAKKMAREWLVELLGNTPRQDLLFFKQSICKMLLENKNLLEERTASEQSKNLFEGLLILIFGSGGQCLVAEEMKIKQAYLEIYKICNREINRTQSDFLLLLELIYKNTTEQAFRDTLSPVLQELFKKLSSASECYLKNAKENLAEQWKSRSLSRVHLLARSAFSYLTTKFSITCLDKSQKNLDLNSVHNFTRVSRLFGKPFSITTDTDEVAERVFSGIAMNPLYSGVIKTVDTVISFSLEKFYWNTQLEKIIQPWLSTHFEEKTYFQLNDLAQWFSDLLEGFRTKDNENEIDRMQEELSEEIPKINGYPIAQEQQVLEEFIPKPTIQALLIFAYGINLLKMRDSKSFFNYVDKKMQVSEIEEPFDPDNFKQLLQKIRPFLNQDMQNDLDTIINTLKGVEELDQGINVNDLIRKEAFKKDVEDLKRGIIDIRKKVAAPINKEALFFVQ